MVPGGLFFEVLRPAYRMLLLILDKRTASFGDRSAHATVVPTGSSDEAKQRMEISHGCVLSLLLDKTKSRDPYLGLL